MSKYGEQIGRIDQRTLDIKGHVQSIEKKLDKLNGTVDDHSDRIARIEERQSIFAVVSTSISTGISSGIAIVTAWFVGSQK